MPFSRRPRRWPALAATALVSGAAAILVARNFFESEKKIRRLIHTDYGVGDAEFARTGVNSSDLGCSTATR